MLLKNNLAYPCFCCHQRKVQSNSQVRQKKKAKQQNQQNQEQPQQMQINPTAYDGRCSKLSFLQIKQRILKGQKYAVRIRGNLFSVPDYFIDQNYGSVPFVKFDDFVIIKNDGWPTFHFANVIDDWKMEITHVIRGQQWLTNTSKHIYLYKVLGAIVPKYLHLPLIQNQHGKKLAKRDPTSSLITLRKQYQPQAIKNFIFRLGWNPKQTLNQKQQIQLLSQSQMIQFFNAEGITKNPAKFDIKILNHLNKKVFKSEWKQYLILQKNQKRTKTQNRKLFDLKNIFITKIKNNLLNQLSIQDLNLETNVQQDKLLAIWEILHDRITTNSDIKQYGFFFNNGKLLYNSQKSNKDAKALFGNNSIIKENILTGFDKQLLNRNLLIVHNLRLILEHIVPENQFMQQKIAQKISQFLYSNRDLKNQEVYHVLRYMIIQQKSGPSILKVMIILGRERCISLVSNFHQMLKNSQIEAQNNKSHLVI